MFEGHSHHFIQRTFDMVNARSSEDNKAYYYYCIIIVVLSRTYYIVAWFGQSRMLSIQRQGV